MAESEEEDVVRVIRELVRDPEKAAEFVSGDSEEAEQLRSDVAAVIDQVGDASKELFEEKTGNDIQISKDTLAWLAVTRHIINEMNCSLQDAETLWYIG